MNINALNADLEMQIMPIYSRLFFTFSSVRFSVSGFMLRSLIHLLLSSVQRNMDLFTVFYMQNTDWAAPFVKNAIVFSCVDFWILHQNWGGKDFLKRTPLAQVLRSQLINGANETEKLLHDTVIWRKWQPTKWKIIFINYTTNRWIIYEINKKLDIKKVNNPFKNGVQM